MHCDFCGLIFPSERSPAADLTGEEPALSERLLAGRYQLGQRLGERGGILRSLGKDLGAGLSDTRPVIILQAPHVEMPELVPTVAALPPRAEEALQDSEFLPATPTVAPPAGPVWPSLAWEKLLLSKAQHAALPRIVAEFVDDGFAYLIEECPTGRALWDAWDDPEATAVQRFGWLKQIAEALQALHRGGALLEALPPEIVVVTPEGQARLTDLNDLLPLPLPPNPPIRATYYTAPELVLSSEQADARANLYTFGALLYALYVGRELVELDFEMQGTPKPFLERFPDVHPLLGRLISKTFCRDLSQRFPTEEAAQEDQTGFVELLRTLEICRRTLDRVRLEIAAWTTTGMVRTGNEDAFALLHAVESRQDDLAESVLVLLADGMGGYEFGEIAATLAIQVLRGHLLRHKLFAALAGDSGFRHEEARLEASGSAFDEVETPKALLAAALKEANQQVYLASRRGHGHGGMGCTAEAVYVDGRHLFVGHVGDSRTYHLHQGRLMQVTRDQTLVNRLVELGTLTPQEAENHPRRHELQQAIGGQLEVEPALYHAAVLPGDWIVICSDGLSNHLAADQCQEMLLRATSAEMAARRLVNLVNLAGATDNTTVVVIRAT
ncbi:MAG: protein phosphatase 2C domain-containing protein [Gemmataceae bacterium]|nr:protein phosphatase 2C domain-containing protein [Gemmataceae bacterium]